MQWNSVCFHYFRPKWISFKANTKTFARCNIHIISKIPEIRHQVQIDRFFGYNGKYTVYITEKWRLFINSMLFVPNWRYYSQFYVFSPIWRLFNWKSSYDIAFSLLRFFSHSLLISLWILSLISSQFPEHLLSRIKPVGIADSDPLQKEFKENIRPNQNSAIENQTNDPISSNSMPSRKRKADQNSVKSTTTPPVSAVNEEIDAYTFIDDSPLPTKKSRSRKNQKQKRSPVNLKRKRSKQQWPIIVEKIEQPRKRPIYSIKVKTPVGKAALKNAPKTAPKTDMERILENVRQINAMVSKQNGPSSVASSSCSCQSASKNQDKINTTQSTPRSLNSTHFSGVS